MRARTAESRPTTQQPRMHTCIKRNHICQKLLQMETAPNNCTELAHFMSSSQGSNTLGPFSTRQKHTFQIILEHIFPHWRTLLNWKALKNYRRNYLIIFWIPYLISSQLHFTFLTREQKTINDSMSYTPNYDKKNLI